MWTFYPKLTTKWLFDKSFYWIVVCLKETFTYQNTESHKVMHAPNSYCLKKILVGLNAS